MGFWAIDEKPTGSKDPYALRRAALGVVRIILENNIRISSYGIFILPIQMLLKQQVSSGVFDKLITEEGGIEFISENISKVKNDGLDCTWCNEPIEVICLDILAFLADRLKVYLRDKGLRHDLIDAIFALGEDDLVSIVNQTNALQSFLETSDGENLLAGYKRAANILKAEAKKGDLPEGAPSKPKIKESAALYEALQKASPNIEKALVAENYADSMQILAKLRTPIDAFFTDVQVISDDTAVKENNLRLLLQIRDTARQIADFDRING